MRLIAGRAQRAPVVATAVIVCGLGILVFSVLAGLPVYPVSVIVTATVVFVVGYRALLTWQALLALLILVILFIPIRRYALPGSLPFELEPYRIFVALVMAGWTASLLADPRVQLRRTGLEAPIGLFALAALASLVVNPDIVASVEPEVVKKVMFFASFILVFYFVASVVRATAMLDFLLTVLVAGGAVVAAFAIAEARTGFNAFNHLSAVIPVLEPHYVPEETVRATRLRVFASAQHPIALGAALAMLLPLAFYLARRKRRNLWWGAALLIAVGALASISRTSVLMLGVIALIFLWLRPRETTRLWPALLPALVAIHFAIPGTLDSLKKSFVPQGGLVAEQARAQAGRGRISSLKATWPDFERRPLLGQGFATRVTAGADVHRNAIILDNQWWRTTLETGLAGTLALVWLIARFIRRLGARAKEDRTEHGLLAAALASSIAAYGVSMFTYDSFSFIQVTFLFFITLGFGAALLRLGEEPEAVWVRAPGRELHARGT